jgi:hypothetical protein
MAIAEPLHVPPPTLMEAASACTTPLDAAADYWRANVERLLPMYVLAMAPHVVAMGIAIAAIAGEQRTAAAQCCIHLAGATIWRWIWISRLQMRVQDDVRSQVQTRFLSRLPQILLTRLYCNIAMSWGIVLMGVPTFYGLFIGSYAAPLLLEGNEPAMFRIRAALTWIHHSGKRLFRMLLVIGAISTLLVIVLFVCQYVLAGTILPSFLSVDTSELSLTLDGWAWRLSVFYFAFLVIDAYWSVAAVFIYYDSQSRRTASDLRARLMLLTEGAK